MERGEKSRETTNLGPEPLSERTLSRSGEIEGEQVQGGSLVWLWRVRCPHGDVVEAAGACKTGPHGKVWNG